jgi:hypothetical protein
MLILLTNFFLEMQKKEGKYHMVREDFLFLGSGGVWPAFFQVFVSADYAREKGVPEESIRSSSRKGSC